MRWTCARTSSGGGLPSCPDETETMEPNASYAEAVDAHEPRPPPRCRSHSLNPCSLRLSQRGCQSQRDCGDCAKPHLQGADSVDKLSQNVGHNSFNIALDGFREDDCMQEVDIVVVGAGA